jgi:hypothetical protein
MHEHAREFCASIASALAGLILSISTAGILLTSPTWAQSGGWQPSDGAADGGSVARSAAAAQRTLTPNNCGRPGGSQIRTETTGRETDSTSFVTVPGAEITFRVPAGVTRCLRVVFTGEAGCAGNNGPDFCYVRALINGGAMHPNGSGEQVFASDDTTAESHAYEWIRRVGPGTHHIEIQGRVADSDTTFFLDDWTLDAQVQE